MNVFILYAIFSGILLTVLAGNVSRIRLRDKVSLGEGDNNPALRLAIRAHGNACEQIPVFGLLLLAMMFSLYNTGLMFAIALTFMVARILHALGLIQQRFVWRRLGAGLSFASTLLASGLLLITWLF